MKKFLVLATLLALVSCKKVSETQQIGDSIVLSKEEYESLKRATTPEYPRVLGEFSTDIDGAAAQEVKVIAVDSCEYIGELVGTQDNYLTHKGNCKFCQARREVEYQRFVDEVVYRLTNKVKDTVH